MCGESQYRARNIRAMAGCPVVVPVSSLSAYFRFSLAYLVFALVVAYAFAPVDAELLYGGLAATLNYARVLAKALALVLPLIIGLAVYTGWGMMRARIGSALYAAAATIVLQCGFSILKSSIPFIVPFWADPYLETADEWLLGQQAWRLLDVTLPGWTAGALHVIYLVVWTVLAFATPTVIALTDEDRPRVGRAILLYLFCWIFLGNILATIFASVGPVFHDAVYGGDRYADLATALGHPDRLGDMVAATQAYLLGAYQSRSMAFGSGISAFPSIHVAIATMVALYAIERFPALMPVGVAYVLVTFFLSIWTGYHYALDGYASILLIFVAWVALRRFGPLRLAAQKAGTAPF